MGEEVSEDQTKLVDDLDVKDEAERLLKEVEVTIKEVQETKFYAKLTRQMRNSVIFKRNLERVLGGNSQLQMVIYALGSMEFSFDSQYQLAIAILLRQDFAEWIGGIEVFDPRLSPADIIVLKELGCEVLLINEECQRKVNGPTLFFMPYAVICLVGNLLGSNWCPSQINQMIVLTNRMSDTVPMLKRSKIYKDTLGYMKAISKYAKEVEINANYGPGVANVFYDFAWHFYDVDPLVDMDMLLCGKVRQRDRLRLLEMLDFVEYLKENKIFDAFEVDTDELDQRYDYRFLKDLVEERFKEAFSRKKIYQDCDDWSSFYGVYRGPRKYRMSSRPPPKGWVKLNISGRGCDEHNPGGFSGICRNERNEQILVFYGCLENVDKLDADVAALKHGMRLLRKYSPVKNLIVEGDNLCLMRWLNRRLDAPPRKVQGSKEILHILKSFKLVSYHVYEEANSDANYLSNKGALSGNRWYGWCSLKSFTDDRSERPRRRKSR
ncbi:hypothetical protein RJ639_002604 [Escallonia herrerae]|uniref:RNase H type-1 domain-containing protein n=1 Tax=Escallonia herrerae TaxID=1293975 RepID=A0AA89BTA5_9ASTE|nr:hypothetical protein RJ639_002604 [Escallonia herrerae]